MERRLIAADKLISGLSSENERWGCKTHKNMESTLPVMSLNSSGRICLLVSSYFPCLFYFFLHLFLFVTIPTQVDTRFEGAKAAACASPGWLFDLCCFPELWRGLQLGLQEWNGLPSMGKWCAGERNPLEPAFQTGNPSDWWGRNQQVRRSVFFWQISKLVTQDNIQNYLFFKITWIMNYGKAWFYLCFGCTQHWLWG